MLLNKMKRSHGFYSKRSRKITKKRRGITTMLRTFEIGSGVRLRVDGSKGALPLRFNGRTAKVIARQGKGYIIEFRDLNAVKRLVVAPIHLETI